MRLRTNEPKQPKRPRRREEEYQSVANDMVAEVVKAITKEDQEPDETLGYSKQSERNRNFALGVCDQLITHTGDRSETRSRAGTFSRSFR